MTGGGGNGDFSPDRLRAVMRKKRLSQTALAESIGWGRDRISRYVNGLVVPEEVSIERLEAAVGTSLRERRRGRRAGFETGERAASDPSHHMRRNLRMVDFALSAGFTCGGDGTPEIAAVRRMLRQFLAIGPGLPRIRVLTYVSSRVLSSTVPFDYMPSRDMAIEDVELGVIDSLLTELRGFDDLRWRRAGISYLTRWVSATYAPGYAYVDPLTDVPESLWHLAQTFEKLLLNYRPDGSLQLVRS